MAIVSNSSPLILYARIARLDVLRELFGEVLIPPAVHQEVVVAGGHHPDAGTVGSAPWIRSRALSNPDSAHALLAQVDQGEAEAIALALELGSPTAVILDDYKARRLGRRRGVNIVGSGGVLVLAKRQRLIPLVRPILDELRSAGLYLSETTYHEILTQAGEASVERDAPAP